MSSRGECKGVRSKPCGPCPWLKSNQGRTDNGGLYSEANRRDLWLPFMNGAAPGMTCHPTDADYESPDGSEHPVPDGADWWECAGAVHLVEVELKALDAIAGESMDTDESLDETMRRYEADAAERGVPPMTVNGFLYWASRGQSWPLGAGMPMPDLTDVEWADEVAVTIGKGER